MRIGLISVFCVAAWCRAEWKPIPVPPVDSAAQDPVWSVVAHNGALWATTPQGWFASRDTGRTWQSARPAGFPRNPRLAGTSLGGRLFSAAGCLFTTLPAGLYSTCDDGATWKAGDRGLSGIERLQGDADLLVAGASDDEIRPA